MPIEFACPHCGARTNVADEFAGRTGPCAACGESITIPGGIGQESAFVPAKSGGSNKTVLIVVLVAALGGLVVCTGIMAALLLPAIQAAREAARRSACINNMKQIGLALHNYHDVYDTFPPAYVADETGRPMHSWRVLILPYLEERALYDRYDFDKPWDSPENLALAAQMPPVYLCPSSKGPNNLTSYLAITGAGTAFPGAEATRYRDFIDGTSNTIMVAESISTAVNWLEPKDLDAGKMTFDLTTGGPGELSSDHAGGVVVALYADGHVDGIVDWEIDPGTLRAQTTISGGD